MQNIPVTCTYLYIAELTKSGGTPLRRVEKNFGKTKRKTSRVLHLPSDVLRLLRFTLGAVNADFTILEQQHQSVKTGAVRDNLKIFT